MHSPPDAGTQSMPNPSIEINEAIQNLPATTKTRIASAAKACRNPRKSAQSAVKKMTSIIASSIAGIAAIVCAILGNRNRWLRQVARRALTDCLAFYEEEARLCDYCAANGVFGTDSAAAVKRLVRQSLRDDGMQSPSQDATPYRISQELQKL